MRKKLLFIMLALLACFSNVNADPTNDRITIEDVTVKRGQQALVSMRYNITYDDDNLTYRGFEIKMRLPEGIKLVNDTVFPGKDLVQAVPKAWIKCNTNKEGETVILAFQIDNKDYPQGEGELLNFVIEADASANLGSLSCTTTHIEFSEHPSGSAVILDNSSFNINVVEYERRVIDENDTDFAVASVWKEDIEVKRSIKAGIWSTLCLPFPMTTAQVKEVFGENVQLAQFKDNTTEYKQRELANGTIREDTVLVINFESCNLAEGIIANHPYIIKSENSFESFNLDNVIVEPDEDEALIDYWPQRRVWGGSMWGILSKRVIPNHALFISDNKLYSSNNTTMKAFRCWLEVAGWESDNASVSSIAFSVDGETTGIEGLTVNGKEIVDGKVYTLSGACLGNAQDLQGKLPRGIYIVNNKKVIVK